MAIGKAVNLQVRPTRSVDLCYPIDGVICRQSDDLMGRTVSSLNIEGLYLSLMQTQPGDDSRLVWTSEKIYNHLSPALLSFLRNQAQAADVDNAIRMRQNTYLTTYSPDVIRIVNQVYHNNPADQSLVQSTLLTGLERDASTLNKTLKQAYSTTPGWNGVVKKSTYDNKATQYSGSGHVQFEGISDTHGFEFRYPAMENDMRYRRALIELRQEYLNSWRMSEMCKHGARTFANELSAIDQQITKLQSAYIDTFLIAPFTGIVTAVFRNKGDYVSAGEPVIRVENDETVYLVGTVKYRGMLRVNSAVTVSTTLFDSPSTPPTKISGTVAAVRGHDSVDEQWNVLIKCSNRTSAGEPILPLNYSFSFESTTVDVTAA